MLRRFFLALRGNAGIDAPSIVTRCPFDEDFYLTRYPDVGGSRLDPKEHFLRYGWKEGRSPHPGLDVEAFWGESGDQVWRSPEDVLTFLVESLSEARVASSKAVPGFIGLGIVDGVEDAPPVDQEMDLRDIDFVTFDCWDTLIQRSVHPDYIKLMGARAALSHIEPWRGTAGNGHVTEGSDWALLRLRLQVEGDLALRPVCHACRRDGAVHEYRHMEAIAAWLLEAGVATDRIDEVAELVRGRELSFEREVVHARPVGMSLLRKVQRQKRPVAIVTDTYYGREDIALLLSGVGLQIRPRDIYPSCDRDESKRHGSLLDAVRDERGVAAANHLHVGDSAQADRASQVRGGGVALLVPPPNHEFPLTPSVAAAKMLSRHTSDSAVFAAGRAAAAAEAWNMIEGRRVKDLASAAESHLFWDGYRLGPAIASLLAGAAEQTKLSQIPTNRVFFLSREGHVLADIARRAQRSGLFPSHVGIEHLAVSRVSTLLPTLRNDPSDLMRIWNQYSVQSPAQLWATLRLTQERSARETFSKLGHDWTAPVTYPWRVPTFMTAIEKMWSLIQDDVSEARAGFHAYLLGRRFLSEGIPLCIDVGWRGTIQDNLTIAAERSTRGVYLGLFPMLNPQTGVQKWGIAFDENRRSLPDDSPLRRITPIERLLTAHVPSVHSYSAIGDPIFSTLHDLDLPVIRALETFQYGAAEGAIDALADMRTTSASREEWTEIAAQSMATFLSQPTSSAAALYLSLLHDESFGVGRMATTGERADSWPETRDVLPLETAY